MDSSFRYDILIIGAGMAGLAARRELVSRGHSVLTLEKSRGLSGRAATRRNNPGELEFVADLGAQYFSVPAGEWKALLKAGQAGGLQELPQPMPKAAYFHPQGMSRIGRLLCESPIASDSPLRLSSKAASITLGSDGRTWELTTESGEAFSARSLLVTAPVPQALELLGPLRGQFDESQWMRLAAVRYASCIAAAYILNETIAEESPAILEAPSDEIAGIYDQGKKGLPVPSPTLVVHGSAQWSDQSWALPDAELKSLLWTKVSSAVKLGAWPESYAHALLHKWKYRAPLNPLPDSYERIFLKNGGPLFLAGDGFGDGGLIGALESGRRAAHALGQCLAGTEPLR